MPRSAADVRRVIKAYDACVVWSAKLDDFVRDVGAAFAQLMIDEGAQGGSRIVIGYDMRDSSPSRRPSPMGVTAQGLDVVRIGLASTDEL